MHINIAILTSGKGNVVEELIKRSMHGNFSVCCVISYRECNGVVAARQLGVPWFVTKLGALSREDYDREIGTIIDRFAPDIIICTSYMRLLSRWFVRRYLVVNAHPSLLPAFTGLHARVYKETLAAKVEYTGCTIHIVDEGVDTGRILIQEKVLVLDSDTIDSLRERVQECETALFLKIILAFENMLLL